MRLALYSSSLHHQDRIIDKYVWSMLNNSTPKLTMLIASPDAYNFVAPAFTNFLSDFGGSPSHTIILPEQSTRDDILKTLKESDLLFLSGGNTYHFLNNIRTLNLEEPLKEFAKSNRIIVGSSAGSIIMTPTIEAAGYPSFDADDNYLNLTDFTALNLVKFEITPHYHYDPRADEEFIAYSKRTSRPIYALTDGSAIVVEDAKQTLFGDILMFDKGEKASIHCSR